MTKASLAQGKQLLELFSGASSDQVQQLVEAGDLVQALYQAEALSGVDRASFEAVLAGTLRLPVPPIPWTPVDQYAQRIRARADLRGWAISEDQTTALAERLCSCDHAGRLLPTSVSIWLGQDLEYNRAEAIAWLED